MASLAGPLAYAGQDLSQTLRQMVIDRMTAQKQQQDQALAQREMALKEQDSAQRAKYQDAQLASLSDDRAAKAAQDREAAASGILKPLGPGDVLDPSVVPAVRAGNMGSLIQHQSATLPSTADQTPLTLPSPTQGASIVGTPRMVSNPGNPEQDVYRGSDAQRTDAQNTKAQAAVIADPNTPEPMRGFLRARMMLPKGENVPAQAFETPKVAATGDANYMLHGKPIVALKQNGRLKYQGQDVTDQVTPYTPPQQSIVIQTGDGPQLVNRSTNTASPIKNAGGDVVHAPTNPQIARQQKAAELASGDVNAALDQVDAAEKQGLLGPGAGRVYGQFLAGTIGSTGDPAADERLGGLRAAIKDLNTSYSMAISGTARGGGWATDRLNSVLNSDKFSADLMRGALHEISGALARRAAPSGDKPKLSADELLKKYGG